jgi:DNA-binding response OmpR family regulator
VTVIALPRAADTRGKSSSADQARANPLSILLVRRGPVGIRHLGALQDDPRLELIVTDELTPEWVSVAQRVTAVLVAAMEEPLGALLYALTAGVNVPIVVATSGQHRLECDTAVSAGATACLLMPIRRQDVDKVVKLLISHTPTTRVDSTLRLVLDPVARTARHHEFIVHLSQREFAVLHCLSSRSGRPVPADELLTYVWGDRHGTERTRQIVDVYIFQLRKKLERLGLKGAIATIRGFGYALVPVAAEPEVDAATAEATAFSRTRSLPPAGQHQPTPRE